MSSRIPFRREQRSGWTMKLPFNIRPPPSLSRLALPILRINCSFTEEDWRETDRRKSVAESGRTERNTGEKNTRGINIRIHGIAEEIVSNFRWNTSAIKRREKTKEKKKCDRRKYFREKRSIETRGWNGEDDDRSGLFSRKIVIPNGDLNKV